MKIGILGAGQVGAALAGSMADAGHDAMGSSRHPDRLAAVAGTAVTVGQACAFGKVRIAAVPFGALGDILARDLPRDARPPVVSGRRALPIAGEDEQAKRVVARVRGWTEEHRRCCMN